MIPIVSLLVVLTLSLLVTRVASVALEHTGLGREAARFQARSAFTGVGFTTDEAESVVGDPVRRRIVSALMLFGNVGIVTAVSSLLLSFIGSPTEVEFNLALLLIGLLLLLWLANSAWVDRRLCSLISWALHRFAALDVSDYARLLHVRDDYAISRLSVEEGSWLADRSLRDCALRDEGVLLLGLECPGNNYIGAPGPAAEIRPGDTLILYGRSERMQEIERREPGTLGAEAHAAAIDEQNRRAALERMRARRDI
jgi:hypothetical protein